jgi:hypothetical protein
MRFPIRIQRRWLRRVALGLTVAAVVAPAANAYDYHQPFGADLNTASLPCTPSCSFDLGQPSVEPAIAPAHPRGGLVVAGSIPSDIGTRAFIPAGARSVGPAPTTFAHLSRHPAFSLGGPVASTGGTEIDGPSIAAGIGMGAAFALIVASMGAALTRNRSGLAHA